MRPPLDGAAAATPQPSVPPRFSPRDRYDPEIFNRQYHK
jgi:rRNA maturation protein Nop10